MPSPEPAQQYVITGDQTMLREFARFMAEQHAPTPPCACHGGPDLFAPSPGNEAADLADLIADAIQPGDANYTLLTKLTRKLQAHIRRA